MLYYYNMNIVYEQDVVRIENLKNFHPHQIFENGQSFRFTPLTESVYEGVAWERYLRVEICADNSVLLSPVSKKDFLNIWFTYFDLGRDYSVLFARSEDKALTLGKTYAEGLRVLRQQPLETLISFIISANNNIKRIRGIIENICQRFGTALSYGDKQYYTFPTAERLSCATDEQLRDCGCGYRAPYVIKTARMVAEGYTLDKPFQLPYTQAKKYLMQFPGVGPKVSDCILLFAYGKVEAFPADVWIKRVLEKVYAFSGTDTQIQQFARSTFGRYAGLAQQYLFYYARENRNADQ